MKALKERRTSLRSLVRRGLVILSLFALVFAVSCGGSEGSNDSPGTDVPPVVTRHITSLKVLRAPTIYSFQGQAPDLTGLVVEVKWSDGTTYEQITDTTQFYTIPTTIENPGNNQFALFHNSNKEVYDNLSLPYIAAIRSIDITGKGLTGETIYEDEGVDTTGMTVNARYWPIPEVDTGSVKWDGVATETIKPLPVYSDANRWDFMRDPNAKIAYYKVTDEYYWDDDDDEQTPGVFVNAIWADFQFDNYYKVDKIKVNNSGTFDKFTADDTVYVNPGARNAAAAAWLDLLEDAGVTFDVTYYDNPTVKTKTMADYKRAYNMLDLYGNPAPKASYPVLSVDNFADSLEEAIGVNIFLQYYDREMILNGGNPGRPENSEPKPNQMLITFPQANILENTGVIARWKLSVPPYNPEVIATSTVGGVGGTQADLIAALGTYYDVFRIYGEGDEAIEVKIPFDTALDDPNSYGNGWGGFNFSDFTNDNEGSIVILPNQPFTMNVPNPVSMGGVAVKPGLVWPNGDFDWVFNYDIHPPKPDSN